MPSESKFQKMSQLYAHSVKSHAARPLFGTKIGGVWTWTTYGEFAAEAELARAALAGLGVGKGDRVAVIANNRSEWAVGAYATYGLRASYVPMYEAQHAKEWQYILADCGAKVLLVANEQIRDRIEGVRGELKNLEHIVVMTGSGVAGSRDNKPYNVALLIADMPVLETWAAEHHLTTKGDALLAEAAVKKLFDEQVEKFSAEFKQFEKIRKLALVAEDFTTQNDMLTPSLKVKRRVVLKKYGEQLTALYDA